MLLEPALHFASEITQPLFNKIDAIRYSRQSRNLKEAQDYAERLLQPKYSEKAARAIAKDLVTRYATHDFVIDQVEAGKIGKILDEGGRESEAAGLTISQDMPPEIRGCLDWLALNCFKSWGVGFVEEIPDKATP